MSTLTLQEQLLDAAELLQQAKQIVALTGAGISTESGIPDFRSPGSIWQLQPPVSYRDFINKPEARQQYWHTRRHLSPRVKEARPNAAHRALADLERRGLLLGVITQNFDGLHQDAGNSAERVIELHGTSRAAACTICGARSSITELQERIDAGEVDPLCPACGGFLLFIVVGSSLKVMPAAMLPRLALSRNVPLIIINLQPTSLDSSADVPIAEKAGLALPKLVELL
ncbi:MAG: NAD-dependent deacetylase [Chloroflexi bacterium]|nr:MAG: NAD-dependent deacetylase [Chloroflexota bacterium]